MASNLIFLRSSAVRAVDIQNLNIDHYIKSGFAVKFLILPPDSGAPSWLSHLVDISYEGIEIQRPDGFQELAQFIRGLNVDDTLIIGTGLRLGSLHKHRHIWDAVWGSQATLGAISNYPFEWSFMPAHKRLLQSIRLKKILLGQHKTVTIGRFARHVRLSHVRRFFDLDDLEYVNSSALYRPLDQLWIGPGSVNHSSLLVGSSTRIVPVMSDDADRMMRRGSEKDHIGEPYSVFLDSMAGGLHPDFEYYAKGRSNFSYDRIQTQMYYRRLSHILQRIESEYGMKCIIAAHPKNTVEILDEYLPGFKVEFDNTEVLVRHAQFVIAEPSLSISFCALAKKKTLILNSRGSIPEVSGIASFFSRSLGAQLRTIEDLDLMHSPLFSIDAERADVFNKNFLSGTPSRTQSNAITITDSLRQIRD